MSSSREDSTSTNYDVKLTAGGINIGEIRQVNIGDSITIFNDSEVDYTFTDRDGLWGRREGFIVLSPRTSGRVPVVAGNDETDYEIDAAPYRTEHTPGDIIALKIKMGGGGWKLKPRARHT